MFLIVSYYTNKSPYTSHRYTHWLNVILDPLFLNAFYSVVSFSELSGNCKVSDEDLGLGGRSLVAFWMETWRTVLMESRPKRNAKMRIN